MSSDKRKYDLGLTFVEQGFRACWQNAQDLVVSAKTLLDVGMHAPALSLSVLALEELGKLIALDGLLFARRGDSKSAHFNDALRSHQTKLDSLDIFPLFLGNLMRSDPRHDNDSLFAQANLINIRNLQRDGNIVLDKLEGTGFRGLDRYKQHGFYVGTTDKGLKPPRLRVDLGLSESVYQLVWRATTSIDFLLKGGNLERYVQQARDIRSKLSEAAHQEFEKLGVQEAERLFGASDELP